MDITITFEELGKYISEHFGQTLLFEKVSEKEVCVSYSKKVFLRTVKVPVNITIDAVRDGVICVTYNGGFGIDMMIAGGLSFMKGKLPELANVIEAREGHHLNIALSRLPQTKALVKNVRLNDIQVQEDSFEVNATLK